MGMPLIARLLLAVTSLATAACVLPEESPPPQLDGQTSIISLSDIHGLWGGYALTIYDAGTVYVRHVDRDRSPHLDRRYKSRLKPQELEQLKTLIADSGYFEFREKHRSGIPDEARPHIAVSFGGRELETAKWANDKDARFDRVYDLLMALAKKVTKTRPIAIGRLI
jgi:hypothetical protein